MTANAIDTAVLNELKDTAGEDFVSELVATFFEEAPAMLAGLRTAHGAGDADTFRRTAHSLKSNGSTFGAMRLASMARDLELGGLPAGTDALDALDAEYQRAAAALKELVGG